MADKQLPTWAKCCGNGGTISRPTTREIPTWAKCCGNGGTIKR